MSLLLIADASRTVGLAATALSLDAQTGNPALIAVGIGTLPGVPVG